MRKDGPKRAWSPNWANADLYNCRSGIWASVFPAALLPAAYISLGLLCPCIIFSLTALASSTSWGVHHNSGFTSIDSQGLFLRIPTMSDLAWTQWRSETAEEDSTTLSVFHLSCFQKQQAVDEFSSAANLRWTLPHLVHNYRSFAQLPFLLLFPLLVFANVDFPQRIN